MIAPIALLLSSSVLFANAAAVHKRAVACPDLAACGGNSPFVNSNADTTRCSYVKSGSDIFRCFYSNEGALVASPVGAFDSSDAVCPSTNVGTCPVTPPTPTSSAVPSASATVPAVEGGRAIHPNGNFGKCLDVYAALYQDGTAVDMYDCNGSGAQAFVWNEGSTKIRVAGTKFCLDAGTNPGNGIGMKIWSCIDDLPAQQFYRTEDKRIAVEGKGQCLDLTNGSLDNYSQAQTWACSTGNTNQVWTE
ncbi:ricin B lectin domain-containing protein [Mrakia frigida]|uniref:RICIN domain-containing protein n=1 Tax=Mrakia frigida TaxID=29902 RepID=UPI003FCC05C3